MTPVPTSCFVETYTEMHNLVRQREQMLAELQSCHLATESRAQISDQAKNNRTTCQLAHVEEENGRENESRQQQNEKREKERKCDGQNKREGEKRRKTDTGVETHTHTWRHEC